MARKYQSFREFWPFYLEEHRRPLTRTLHFVGTTGVVVLVVASALTRRWSWLLLAPVIGYGFAWTAHAFVERNRPATFTYPLWSLLGDFKLWAWMLVRKL